MHCNDRSAREVRKLSVLGHLMHSGLSSRATAALAAGCILLTPEAFLQAIHAYPARSEPGTASYWKDKSRPDLGCFATFRKCDSPWRLPVGSSELEFWKSCYSVPLFRS